MYLGVRLRDALSRLMGATSLDALCEALVSAATELGFEHVALIQHGGLPRLVRHSLVVTNYPRDFVDFYIKTHQFVFDPVYDVSETLDRPFTWDEIPALFPMTEKQLDLFDEAKRHGLVHGVTVPLHIPGERRASCTFATSRAIEVTPNLMAVLHLIAAFGFHTALRLHQPEDRSSGPKLTRREAECTTLIALGKTDWEIGEILGLSASTVKYFVSAAKQRYGVYKRSELVARALMDAQILNLVRAAETQDDSA
jgi:LuxR family quorum-sensing system transcriptional regulator CciR